MKQKKKNNEQHNEFGFTKFLSWMTLFIVLCSGIILSLIIIRSTQKTVNDKQHNFLLLLGKNLHHQIFRQFYVKTIETEGFVLLSRPHQFKRLDDIIQLNIYGLKIDEVRIYDLDKVISYSTKNDLVGKIDLYDERVINALETHEYTFSINNNISMYDLLFKKDISNGVMLDIVYPLRIEHKTEFDVYGPTIGVLKIFQDISEDYRTLYRLQVLIIVTSFVTSILLFLTLFMIIRRVSKINSVRLSEKEKMERTLAQNEKLVTIGRMVAGVAHEIRNPLGIIRSSSELLLKKRDADDINTKILNAIHNESKRLSQTVNDFLDYARPKQPKEEIIDFSNIIEQALTFLQSEFEKNNIIVEKQYVENLTIKGDKDLLYRAIYNIIINAIQAMEDGGTFTIRSEKLSNRIKIIFTDTGSGFDESVLNKIGEPFMTTKDNGTGLGLTIVINIIESNNGEVSFSNRSTTGANVTLEFNKAE